MATDKEKGDGKACRPACPVCGGELIRIRAKLQSSRSHTICESGRG